MRQKLKRPAPLKTEQRWSSTVGAETGIQREKTHFWSKIPHMTVTRNKTDGASRIGRVSNWKTQMCDSSWAQFIIQPPVDPTDRNLHFPRRNMKNDFLFTMLAWTAATRTLFEPIYAFIYIYSHFYICKSIFCINSSINLFFNNDFSSSVSMFLYRDWPVWSVGVCFSGGKFQWGYVSFLHVVAVNLLQCFERILLHFSSIQKFTEKR